MNIKKLMMMVFISLLTCLMASAQTPSDERWLLFSNAEVVKVNGSRGQSPWAIELSSDCRFAGGKCDLNTFTFSGVRFQKLQGGLYFANIYELSADYAIKAGGADGRSPRFQLNVDTDSDGVANGTVFIYLGRSPYLTENLNGWRSSGNLMGSLDQIFDLTQLGGPQDGTYADAQDLIGSATVLGIQLVVDGGWAAPDRQTVLVNNVTVNEHTIRAGTYNRSHDRRILE
jgi:hypothetical protein